MTLATFPCVRRPRRLLLAALLALSATAPAGDGDAPGAGWDDASRALLEGWAEKAYRLEEDGVERVECVARVVVESQGRRAEAKATYRFEDGEGSLEWDEPMLGAQLARQGWSVRTFDALVRRSIEASFAGARLSAEETDAGTRVKVEGEDAPASELHFSKDGVLERTVSRIPIMGKPTDVTITWRHRAVDGRYVVDRRTVSFELPGMGPYEETTTFEIGEQDGCPVWTGAATKSAMGTQAWTFAWTLGKGGDGADATEDGGEEAGDGDLSDDDARVLGPDQAPTPFTAAEIREACPQGRAFTFEIEAPGKPKVRRVMRFVEVDAAGAKVEIAQFLPDGTALGEPRTSPGTWEDYQRHASYPKATTEIREEEVTTPAGTFDCLLYVVRGDDGAVTRYWFAKTMPGPPVKITGRAGDTVTFTMTLVDRK